LAQGNYQWAVKVNYTNGVVSEPRFTNILLFTPPPPTYSVTFNIIDNQTQQQVSGAKVVFNGETLTGYVAQQILPGKYPYSVSKEGYSSINGEVTVENENISVPVVLIPLSIQNNSITNIQLYPNPFKNEIHISHPELVKSIQITDMVGQIIKQVSYNGKTIQSENLCRGIYYVTIESHTGEKAVFKMVNN
jgi:hypothetical protein